MILSLIGMSSSGKTHWAKRLKKKGFIVFSLDDLIEEGLGEEFKKLGYAGLHDMGLWMGQPYAPQYQVHSKRYLDLETTLMREVFFRIENEKLDNVIVDTTGSVIYTGEDVLATLKKHTTVVYLETPMSVQEQMYQLYLQQPKPVIWGDMYKQHEGETQQEALGRGYKNLLAYRTAAYEKLADITIDYFAVRKHITVDTFLQKLNTPQK